MANSGVPLVRKKSAVKRRLVAPPVAAVEPVQPPPPRKLEALPLTPVLRAYLDQPLCVLGLNMKAVTALENDQDQPDKRGRIRHVHTIGELLQSTPEEILSTAKLGEKTLAEIYACLTSLGFLKPTSAEESLELASQANQRDARQKLEQRLGYLVDLSPGRRSQ